MGDLVSLCPYDHITAMWSYGNRGTTPTTNEMSNINNLEEFLAARGFSMKDGPYSWARCFYKYKDWKPMPLGDTGAEIYSFEPDEMY